MRLFGGRRPALPAAAGALELAAGDRVLGWAQDATTGASNASRMRHPAMLPPGHRLIIRESSPRSVCKSRILPSMSWTWDLTTLSTVEQSSSPWLENAISSRIWSIENPSSRLRRTKRRRWASDSE